MSSYVRGTKRTVLTFVPLNTVLQYGWKSPDLAALTGISAGDLATELGHLTPTAAAAIANRVMVIGANSPKPARYSKKFPNAPTTARASVSTFIGYNSAIAATAGGWTRSSKSKGVKLRAPGGSRRKQTAVATLSNGALYAFSLDTPDFNLVSPDLGLQSSSQISSQEALRLVTGTSGTRPGRMRIVDSGGDLTTFFSTANRDSAQAAGFDLVDEELIEFPAAVPPPANP